MMRAFQRLFKHTVVYGAGYMLSRSISLLLLPVHTNCLSRAELGVSTQLYAFILVLSIVYSFGLNTAFLQFFMTEKSEQERKLCFSTAFLFTAFTALVFSVPAVAARASLSGILFGSGNYGSLIVLAAAILSLDALNLLTLNIFRAQEKPQAFVLFQVLNVALNLVLNVFLVVRQSGGVKAVFIANLAASGLMFLALLPVSLHHSVPAFSGAFLKRMLRFGLPMIPYLSALSLLGVMDRFFITRYLGLESTGIYGAAYRLAMIIQLIVTAFRFAWHPFFVSEAGKGDPLPLFARTFTYFTLASSVLFLGVLFFIKEIAAFRVFGFSFMHESYFTGLPIVPAIMLGYIAFGFHLVFTTGIYLKEKTGDLIWISAAAALFNLLANILVIPRLGLTGAALSCMFSYGLLALLTALASGRRVPVRYEWGRFLRIVFLSCAMAVSFYLFRRHWKNIYSAALLLSFPVWLWITGFFERLEKERLAFWRRCRGA